MEKEKTNPHKNHRKRLRNKVEKYGLDCLEYHEILELLLTYTISRKDTNPIGHELINYFGNFQNVIDADFNDLVKVDGIGPESAFFINVLSQFIDIYNKNKQEQKTYTLNSTAKSVQFFRDFYRIKNNEFMVIVCLSKNKKVLKTIKYKGHDDSEICVDLKQISQGISNEGVSGVVLYHTHPFGDVNPSYADILATQRVVHMCLNQGVEFDDHIILNESAHYSFKNAGLIDKMKAQYIKSTDVSNLYLQTVDKELIKDEKIETEE